MYLQQVVKFIGRIKPKKIRKIYKNKITNKDQIMLLDVPTNGNIGDQAIVYATRLFLKRLVPNYSILEVTYTDLNAVLNVLKNNLSNHTLIILNGGGNLGDIYPSEEFNRWLTFKKLKANKKILFPQSISFQKNKKGEKMLKKSISSYTKATNLEVFLREKKSFNFFKNKYKINNSTLVPDIVFSLEKAISINNNKRSGVITLLRNDVEKGNYDLTELYKKFVDKSVKYSDTFVANITVDKSNREKLVLDKINELSKYELVITDRLHGMILSYLSHTPTLVIENNNWKIKSTYETWLKKAPYIEMLSNKPTAQECEEAIRNIKGSDTSYINVSQNFGPLESAIRDGINE
ncbi:polysaccharide pyruvyl transferase family protein [Pediococcus acidilactici]|uniref:polysaccharide pyruvyl transferase family protein n=1 Tax=Pediococcus acidilactici TaxID=1254 RepID=UPI0010584721|nr:polysaccharide pyruvyl transferase family protein [Pediococcus acidilactici]KAF0514939.1 hypothetical protein GBP29_09570 [Pediococcus acidilactici]MCT3036812.1 hypothetical protein [Pediococcus acidilactici]QQC45228.1 polysaccharide pyruvyl transferase family protein [Pediococcus acidilactici]